jgi:hypothetical protein
MVRGGHPLKASDRASRPRSDDRRHQTFSDPHRARCGHRRRLAQAKVTYVELAKRLKNHGFKEETEASITNKLKRGTFAATWFLAVIAALELDAVVLEEI